MTQSNIVRLSAVLDRRPLTVAEAVAVTAQISTGRKGESVCVPTPSGLVLNHDGTLSLEGCAEVAEPSKTAALARFLRRVLPPRAPAPLLLAVARAAGELTLPPFDSTDAFVASIARFSDGDPRAIIAAMRREVAGGGVGAFQGVDEVRRARRASRVPLAAVARDSGIPIYILRQLEWGDFREWRNDEWSVRATRAYSRASGLNEDAVVEVVERERSAQLHPVPVTAPADAPLVRTPPAPLFATVDRRGHTGHRRARAWPLTVAAAVAGLVLIGGGTIIERIERAPLKTGSGAVPAPQPSVQRDIAGRAEGQDVPSAAASSPASSVQPPEAAVDSPMPQVVSQSAIARWRPRFTSAPQLVRATTGEEPSFSPSFASEGSAMFFQSGTPGRSSALVRADTDGRDSFTGDLRVMRIVDDGARNYHVRPSPDGRLIAFDSDRDGERGVYLASSTGADVRRVSGPGFAAIPSWSPDGTRLAFVRAGRTSRVWDLWLLDLRSNETTRLTDFSYGQAWGGSWFPDGRRIAYSHEDQLVIDDLETGARRTFHAPRRGALLRTPAVSPDGRHVVFQVYRDGAWLIDLKDGSMRRILDDPTAEEFAWDAAGHRLAFHSRRSGSWSIWIMAADAP